jgi:hypothetical protein
MEMMDDMPQVRLYCGRETVSQCYLSNFKGTILLSSTTSSIVWLDGSSSFFYS